ncbi:MAG: transposase [Patescibacteria group bacterium]|jgi:transposase-like protein
MRKTFTPNQKANIAAAVLKGQQSIAQIASENEVHPTQVNQWAKIVKDGLPLLFTDKRKDEFKELRDRNEQLYKIIGQRELELDWLKKKLHLDAP